MTHVARQSKGILEALINSKLILAIRIIASISAFIIFLWPIFEDKVRWVAGFAAAALILSWVAQFILTRFNRFQDRIAYAIEARKYGYGYEDLTIKAYLTETNGAMTTHRRVRLKTTSVQNHIRHYLRTFGTQLEDSVEITGLSHEQPRGTRVTAEKVPELSLPSGMVIDVTFDPPLNPREEALYEVREQFPGGSFATTAQQIAQMTLQYEYLAWHIDKPTRYICFEVHVPDSLSPTECGYDVWYGIYSQQTHRMELGRLASLFVVASDGQYTSLRLEVPYPVLGLDYVLTWQYKKQ
jgi:hypothetical protein